MLKKLISFSIFFFIQNTFSASNLEINSAIKKPRTESSEKKRGAKFLEKLNEREEKKQIEQLEGRIPLNEIESEPKNTEKIGRRKTYYSRPETDEADSLERKSKFFEANLKLSKKEENALKLQIKENCKLLLEYESMEIPEFQEIDMDKRIKHLIEITNKNHQLLLFTKNNTEKNILMTESIFFKALLIKNMKKRKIPFQKIVCTVVLLLSIYIAARVSL